MRFKMLTPVLLAASLVAAPLVAAGLTGAAHAQDVTEDITQAQPALPTIDLTIVGHDGTPHLFHAEQAATPQEQTTGLMYRTHIADDGGMLFDWVQPKESQMWMRHCPIGEDMVFIDADGTIHQIAENTVPQSMAIIDSDGPVRATLELQAGLTAKLGIQVGDKVHGGPFPAK